MQRVCARLGTAGNFGTVLLGVLDCAPLVSHPGGHLSRPPGWADGAGELRACAVARRSHRAANWNTAVYAAGTLAVCAPRCFGVCEDIFRARW